MELKAEKLSFQYGKGQRKVLDEFQLTIKDGEILGLMAPSGYGKTTLCKILAGYQSPDTGEVLLDGKPVNTIKGYCPIQMVWQHGITAVDPRMRMKEILKEGGPHWQDLLEDLHIKEEWLNRFPGELSGGELQRFCIARALAGDVKFLLADEITAMLDLISQCEIWKFLQRQVEKRNIGILAVSHDMDLLQQVCTRIERLSEGRIV